MLIFDASFLSSASKGPATERCTMARSVDMQIWPEYAIAPKSKARAHSLMSASARTWRTTSASQLQSCKKYKRTTAGAFPPSSRILGLRCLAHSIAINFPTRSLPVN
jgi:hypothetical protein